MAEDEARKEKAAGDHLTLVERTVFIAAAPEVVFDFLTRPELIARWIGRSVAREPKAGDPFSIEFLRNGRVARGVYREVSPPHRVAFTWGWDEEAAFPPGASLVEIELVPQDGGTLLRLRHSGLPEDAPEPFSPSGHERRWRHYLAKLQTLTR